MYSGLQNSANNTNGGYAHHFNGTIDIDAVWETDNHLPLYSLSWCTSSPTISKLMTGRFLGGNHKLSRGYEINTQDDGAKESGGLGAVVRHGQKAGDVIEHHVGLVEEHVDDLGDEALVLRRLKLLVVLV